MNTLLAPVPAAFAVVSQPYLFAARSCRRCRSRCALPLVCFGIASGRVAVGNVAGDLFTSWLNPTSALIGTLAVTTSSCLAAVYLAADDRRLGRWGLKRAFQTRALGAGPGGYPLMSAKASEPPCEAPTDKAYHLDGRPTGVIVGRKHARDSAQ